jgi:hypothetical protein
MVNVPHQQVCGRNILKKGKVKTIENENEREKD